MSKLKDYISMQLDQFYKENKANLVGQVLVQQGETFLIITKTKNKEAKENVASLIDELESKMSMKREYKFKWLSEEEFKGKNPEEVLKKKIQMGLKHYKQSSYVIDKDKDTIIIYGQPVEQSDL